MPASPLKLAVLLSGGGRSLQNLIDRIDAGTLDAEIVLVLASNASAGGLQRAEAAGIPAHVVSRKAYADADDFAMRVFSLIREAKADLVCLAGFLSLLPIPDDFAGRVLNIHPALLPSFGGKGMYGPKVHAAVLDHGCKVSGCTVHLADNAYDTGPIVVQRCCTVAEDDTPDTLAARVFAEECEAYPEAIRLIAENRVRIDGRRTRITGG
ncbi:MAG: phosphoribosylglycinamide formyltransferase [Phycisphaeraceae bacterium]